MSGAEKDGGLAFPGSRSEPTSLGARYDTREVNYPGLTVRDWFAGQALTAVTMVATMPGVGKTGGGPLDESDLAEAAYAFADAMLKERSK